MSYSGAVCFQSPTEFILQLMDQEYLHHGRKLMNIDKITFKCGAQVTVSFMSHITAISTSTQG